MGTIYIITEGENDKAQYLFWEYINKYVYAQKLVIIAANGVGNIRDKFNTINGNIKKGDISEQELESARQLIVSTSKLIPESGENLITYYYDKEMNGEVPDLDKFINDIQKVKIEDIVDVAQDVTVDTIYFLRD